MPPTPAARTYGWVATGIGILIMLVAIGAIVLYGAFFASLMNSPQFRNPR